MNNTLYPGCIIDGAVPRNDAERILKLADFLSELDPDHSLIKEVSSFNTRYTFEEGLADEYLQDLEDAINNALPNHLMVKWESGDFLLLTIDPNYE